MLNIADHFTRVNVKKAPTESKDRVFGMLFGTQDGRKVDICASVEMLCPVSEGKHALRRDIFETSLKLCTSSLHVLCLIA